MIYWKYSQDLLAATEKQYLWGKYSALSNYPINRASLNVLALFSTTKIDGLQKIPCLSSLFCSFVRNCKK